MQIKNVKQLEKIADKRKHRTNIHLLALIIVEYRLY